MAAGNLKSDNVTNITADPIVIVDRKKGQVKTVIDQVAVDASANLDDAGDALLFGPIPSNAVILDIQYLCDDLEGGTALEGDWGLVYSGIGGSQAEDGNDLGDAIDINCFADGHESFDDATLTWTSVRFLTDDIVDVEKEAWEVGGLTEDPGGLFLVAFTVGTAVGTPQDGDVIVKIDYI